jgi:uncharacterized protein
MTRMLLDTGPLVAFLSKQDQFHTWSLAEWSKITPPLITCEAVITEACFLLQKMYGWQEAIGGLIDRGTIAIGFDLGQESVAVCELLIQYRSVPMSLADACMVRMAELYPERPLLTTDSDFIIYRKNRNQPIALSIPTL